MSVQVFVNRYMSDIRSCYLVLAVGVAVSFVLGFVFLVGFIKLVERSCC